MKLFSPNYTRATAEVSSLAPLLFQKWKIYIFVQQNHPLQKISVKISDRSVNWFGSESHFGEHSNFRVFFRHQFAINNPCVDFFEVFQFYFKDKMPTKLNHAFRINSECYICYFLKQNHLDTKKMSIFAANAADML